MEKRNNKIFLLGNGFDLSHGLETSYKDFITTYLRESYLSAYKNTNKVYEDDCIRIKLANHSWDNIDELCSDNFEFKHYNKQDDLLNFDNGQIDFQLKAKNDFVRFILMECFESDWNGIEDSILKFLKTSHSNLIEHKNAINIDRKNSLEYRRESENIRNLNKSVDCLKKRLITYLNTQNATGNFKEYLFTEGIDWGKVYPQSEQRDYDSNSNREVLFLNFNYTTYISKYRQNIRRDVEDYYTNFQTINIHGDINDPIDNIIFGIGDEQNDFYSEIETLYDDDWLKSMKSFHYFRTDNYRKLLGFIAKGDYEINILGHSCSITDRTLLNMLFENEYCKKIHVSHYRGMDSYLTTTYNVARNFKDKVKLRSVLQHFNPKLKM